MRENSQVLGPPAIRAPDHDQPPDAALDLGGQLVLEGDCIRPPGRGGQHAHSGGLGRHRRQPGLHVSDPVNGDPVPLAFVQPEVEDGRRVDHLLPTQDDHVIAAFDIGDRQTDVLRIGPVDPLLAMVEVGRL